jgi:hypothetical protein
MSGTSWFAKNFLKIPIALVFLIHFYDASCQNNLFYILKINPTKLISNELTLSFEIKQNNKGYEIELGYIYPTSNPDRLIPSAGIELLGSPLLCHTGASVNLYYKKYFQNHWYIGGQLMERYMFFKDKWLYTGGMSDEGETTLCSQFKNVFGLGFRSGVLGIIKGFIIEPYYSVGLKLITVNTQYYSYIKSGNKQISGSPPHTFPKDNCSYFQPYINLGFKIGFGWPYKTAFDN